MKYKILEIDSTFWGNALADFKRKNFDNKTKIKF